MKLDSLPHLLHSSLRCTLPPSLAPTRAPQLPYDRQLYDPFPCAVFIANDRCRTPRSSNLQPACSSCVPIPQPSSSPFQLCPPSPMHVTNQAQQSPRACMYPPHANVSTQMTAGFSFGLATLLPTDVSSIISPRVPAAFSFPMHPRRYCHAPILPFQLTQAPIHATPSFWL